MLKFINDKIEYTYTYCQQCGACGSVCPKHAIRYENKDNGLKEIIVDDSKCVRCKRCVNVCPANRLIQTNDYLNDLSKKDYFFAYHEDSKIRRNSSSGGACKTLIIESLKSGYVDGVYSLRKIDTYPSAVGEFYTKDNIPTYEEMPNSVYHSVMACTEIGKVSKVRRLMIVGTSCQLYALEKSLRGKYEDLIKVCIFCKQQKHLGSTRFLSKVIGTSIPADLNFTSQYRGIGWPGIVCINDKQLKWERAAGLAFGRRLWCVPGCDICGDPFGMEVYADISLMDPWTIRQENELGETLVTVHTATGLQLLNSTPRLVLEKKNYQDIQPALGEDDIWRKRACVPYYLGEQVPQQVISASEAEMSQRHMLENLLEHTPRLPFIFYRLLNKLLPKKRDRILTK